MKRIKILQTEYGQKTAIGNDRSDTQKVYVTNMNFGAVAFLDKKEMKRSLCQEKGDWKGCSFVPLSNQQKQIRHNVEKNTEYILVKVSRPFMLWGSIQENNRMLKDKAIEECKNDASFNGGFGEQFWI